jgi:hypothetical protein
MANTNINGIYLGHGLNENRRNVVQVTAPLMANTDTLTVTLPSGVDKSSLPQSLSVFNSATPSVALITLAVTSHNKTTGVTVLTASGAVAVGSTVTVDYVEPSI